MHDSVCTLSSSAATIEADMFEKAWNSELSHEGQLLQWISQTHGGLYK